MLFITMWLFLRCEAAEWSQQISVFGLNHVEPVLHVSTCVLRMALHNDIFFTCSIARISGNPTGHWLWTSFGSFHSRRPGDRSNYFDFCSAALFCTQSSKISKWFPYEVNPNIASYAATISAAGSGHWHCACSLLRHCAAYVWHCLTITGFACCFDCVSSHLIQVLKNDKNVKTLCRTRKHVDTRTIQDVLLLVRLFRLPQPLGLTHLNFQDLQSKTFTRRD